MLQQDIANYYNGKIQKNTHIKKGRSSLDAYETQDGASATISQFTKSEPGLFSFP